MAGGRLSETHQPGRIIGQAIAPVDNREPRTRPLVHTTTHGHHDQARGPARGVRHLGEITAQAYLGDGLLDFGENDEYLGELRDVAKPGRRRPTCSSPWRRAGCSAV